MRSFLTDADGTLATGDSETELGAAKKAAKKA